jgi:hypothetical protein
MRLAALSLFLLLEACGRPSPVANGAQNAAALPTANKPTSSPNGAPPRNPALRHPVTEAAKSIAIPAALQGRWGLTPMDCTSTRGDAKGLLIVNADGLRFYESHAAPTADVQTGPNSMAGSFDFTGEGQNWSKYQAIELRGRQLIRTESNPTASFTYAKCD